MKQDKALGERLEDTRPEEPVDARCSLRPVLDNPELADLWAWRKRRVTCPEECVVTLGMTSKCVWVLLARQHRRFRAVVTALPFVSMESMAGGLSGMRE